MLERVQPVLVADQHLEWSKDGKKPDRHPHHGASLGRLQARRSGEERYHRIMRFWTRIFAVSFAMGIYYMNRLINKGPQDHAPSADEETLPNRPIAAAHGAGREALGK